MHACQVGSNGINAAFEGWGNTLLNAYGKTRDAFKSDYALNYLGYVRLWLLFAVAVVVVVVGGGGDVVDDVVVAAVAGCCCCCCWLLLLLLLLL